MSSDIAIRVSALGKCYQIYGRPQDRLKQSLWLGRRRFYREFWALRDATFDVRRGEAVGIIGRNGSGKSTLLQIVAGTVAPSTGDVEVNGRVAALLELGSGFNPEFSGRENVFLNGAILGMPPGEIAARFDEIASFADIGEFIEQPVKIYSSGMLVRLAFAVQAFLKPDVLIVDEALAVGDLAYQHKCMRRIRQLLDGGTTLLLVSHGLDMVKRFCDRGLWLDEGRLRYSGDAGVAVEAGDCNAPCTEPALARVPHQGDHVGAAHAEHAVQVEARRAIERGRGREIDPQRKCSRARRFARQRAIDRRASDQQAVVAVVHEEAHRRAVGDGLGEVIDGHVVAKGLAGLLLAGRHERRAGEGEEARARQGDAHVGG